MQVTPARHSGAPSKAPRPLLEVRNISCNYELERAVFDLSLTVNRGEQVCLLGPSGCGKTTVLRAIAGFHPLLTGGIFINDQQVSAVGAMVPPEARRVGMVFQDHALFPHLSVRQNIASGLRQLSAHEQKNRRRGHAGPDGPFPVMRRSTRTNFLAASSSGLRSPGHLRRNRCCC